MVKRMKDPLLAKNKNSYRSSLFLIQFSEGGQEIIIEDSPTSRRSSWGSKMTNLLLYTDDHIIIPSNHDWIWWPSISKDVLDYWFRRGSRLCAYLSTTSLVQFLLLFRNGAETDGDGEITAAAGCETGTNNDLKAGMLHDLTSFGNISSTKISEAEDQVLSSLSWEDLNRKFGSWTFS